MITDRICQTCGITFPGGPRAWYCPECRVERKRMLNRKRGHKAARPIGSTDLCANCGKQYIVNGGLQQYCPECAPIMRKKVANEQSTAWYHKTYDTPEKRAERSENRRKHYAAHRNEINAARRFARIKNAIKINAYNAAYYKRHPEKFKEYGKKYRNSHKEKLAAYYKAYAAEHREQRAAQRRAWTEKNRDHINETARKNYKKRKEQG